MGQWGTCSSWSSRYIVQLCDVLERGFKLPTSVQLHGEA